MVDEALLFHSDNITLGHNLLLCNQFTRTIYETNTVASYDSCIHHDSQSKGMRFICPPIKGPNRTLSTKGCNPNKDIITTKPTTQIQELEAQCICIELEPTLSQAHDSNGFGKGSIPPTSNQLSTTLPPRPTLHYINTMAHIMTYHHPSNKP